MILKKFLDHQPLYRQAEALKRDYDWALSPATMGKWVERVAVTLQAACTTRSWSRITVARDYVQMDESGIRVLSCRQAPSELTRAGCGSRAIRRVGPLPSATIRAVGSAKLPASVLADFSGVLQTDGWGRLRQTALKGLAGWGSPHTSDGMPSPRPAKVLRGHRLRPDCETRPWVSSSASTP